MLRNIKTAHQGHNPEIEINSDTTAWGRWTLNDHVETSDNRYFRGYSTYEDEYVKDSGNTSCFKEQRDEKQTRWFNQARENLKKCQDFYSENDV